MGPDSDDVAVAQGLSQAQSENGTFEMDHSIVSSRQTQRSAFDADSVTSPPSIARHTFGLILLLCVVFLWTLCNFLGSVSCRKDRGYGTKENANGCW
jgi:hypothetical protein